MGDSPIHAFFVDPNRYFVEVEEGVWVPFLVLATNEDVYELLSASYEEDIEVFSLQNIIERDLMHEFTTSSVPLHRHRKVNRSEGTILKMAMMGVRWFRLYHKVGEAKFLPCDCESRRIVIDVAVEAPVNRYLLIDGVITNEDGNERCQKLSVISVTPIDCPDIRRISVTISPKVLPEQLSQTPVDCSEKWIRLAACLIGSAVAVGHPLGKTTPMLSAVLLDIFSMGIYPATRDHSLVPSKERMYRSIGSYTLVASTKGDRSGVFTNKDFFACGLHNAVVLFDIISAYTETLRYPSLTNFSRDSGVDRFWSRVATTRRQSCESIESDQILKFWGNSMAGRLNQESLSLWLHQDVVVTLNALFWATHRFVYSFLWMVHDRCKLSAKLSSVTSATKPFHYIALVTDGVMVEKEHAEIFQSRFDAVRKEYGVTYSLKTITGSHLLLIHANKYIMRLDRGGYIVRGGGPSTSNHLPLFDTEEEAEGCQLTVKRAIRHRRNIEALLAQSAKTALCGLKRESSGSLLCQAHIFDSISLDPSTRQSIIAFIGDSHHYKYLTTLRYNKKIRRVLVSCHLVKGVSFVFGLSLACVCGVILPQQAMTDTIALIDANTSDDVKSLCLQFE